MQLSVVAGLACLASAHALAQDERPSTCVGRLGDPVRISFDGASTFTPQAIVEGLRDNADFLLAAHPAAPLEAYVDTVRLKIIDGYRRAGFPDAEVSIALPEARDRIVVRVTEGPRFAVGDIRIEGARSLPPDRLVAWLKTSQPPTGATSIEYRDASGVVTRVFMNEKGEEVEAEDPAWAADQRPPFNDAAIRKLNGAIRRGCSEMGYFFPKFEAKVVPDRARGRGDLVIRFIDEGPPGLLGEVDIVGAVRNSRESVLLLLGLEPGKTVLSQESISLARRRLIESARFYTHSVTPAPPAEPGQPVRLRVELTEYEHAPPLGTDFSEAKKALLRFRDWLSTLALRDEDAVIDFTARLKPAAEDEPAQAEKETGKVNLATHASLTGRMVVSPRKGMTCRMEMRLTERPRTWGIGLVAAPGAFQLLSMNNKRKLAGAPNTGVIARFSILPDPDSEIPGQRFSIRFAGGFRTSSHQPFSLSFSLAPTAFIRLAHFPEDSTCVVEKGELKVAGKGYSLRVNAATGRLIEFHAIPDGTEEKEQYGFRVRVEAGAFGSEMEETAKATSGWPNVWDDARPVTSLTEFLCGEYLEIEALKTHAPDPERDRRAVAVRALLGRNVLGPLDQLMAAEFDEEDVADENFLVPEDEGGRDADLLGTLVAKMVMPLGEKLFPRESWPWTLCREAGYVLTGRGKYTSKELNRIYQSERTGPIGCLAAAWLLSYVDEAAAKSFARMGLRRLEAEEFRNDCGILVEGDTVTAKCVAALAEHLWSLPEADVEAIAGGLEPAAGDCLRRLARTLREGKNRTVAEVLPEALGPFWEEVLKEKVEGALRGILEPKPAAPEEQETD